MGGRSLTHEQKQKLWAGRAAYHAAQKAAKAQMPKGAEKRAIEAQGGDPSPSPLEIFRKQRKEKAKAKPVKPTLVSAPAAIDFESMDLEELRLWVTRTKLNWDLAITALRGKEAQYSADHTSVACACGCGLKIDLSHGRFASSEAYYDGNHQIKTRYWATQRCVQAYRLAQSPEYKAQVRKEIEERMKLEHETPTNPRVLEA